MPTYVFECKNKKCKKVYEDLTKYDETGKYADTKCPHCGSTKKTQRLTTCGAIMFTNPRGTSKADNFSYVAGWNMENAKDERRKAEAASHMGRDPYPDNKQDIEHGNYGEVE